MGEPLSHERGLAQTRFGQGRLGLALEPPLDDVLRLAVADEDQRRVEAIRDQ
jgi:hypothetical protein